MIGRSIAELTRRINLEQADFRAAAIIAVANDCDCVLGDQHLVIPGRTRINVGRKRIHAGDRLQRSVIDGDGEQPATAQDHQVIAMHLDYAAFVNARMLHVGN